MKKRIIIIVAVVLSVCAVLFAGYNLFYSNPYMITYGAKITDNPIANLEFCYNDSIDYNALIQIGDKLYYNYEPKNKLSDMLRYGLYEISSYGAHRIYWNGLKIMGDYLFPITEIDGKVGILYNTLTNCDTTSGQVYICNTVTHGFDLVNQPQNFPSEEILQYKYINGVYFYFSENCIHMQNGEALEKVLDFGSKYNSVLNWYDFTFTSNDKFYFLKPKGDILVICSYDIKSRSETELNETPLSAKDDYNLHKLVVLNDEEAVILALDTQSLGGNGKDGTMYLFKLGSKESPRELFKTSYANCSFAAHRDKIYFGLSDNPNSIQYDEMGLYSFDIHNGEKPQKIYDGEVRSVYILDENWVYFTDKNYRLYRITQDGKTLENVFG